MTAEIQSKMSEKLSPKNPFWILFGLVVVLLLAIILSCLFTLQANGSEFEANPHSSEDTVQAFVYSLAYNKLDHIRSYVSRDKWEFIDSWSTLHIPVSPDCKAPRDIDLGPVTMIGYDSNNQSHLNYSFFFNRDCPNYYYTFSVGGVLVDLVNNKWQISGWDQICEETIEEQCY
jgi:hypothetical protein